MGETYEHQKLAIQSLCLGRECGNCVDHTLESVRSETTAVGPG